MKELDEILSGLTEEFQSAHGFSWGVFMHGKSSWASVPPKISTCATTSARNPGPLLQNTVKTASPSTRMGPKCSVLPTWKTPKKYRIDSQV